MEKGFTLIEFIFYICLVAVILTVIGAIGLNVLFGKAKLMSIEEVSQNARIVLERVAERIRNADAVNSPVRGSSASSLSLRMADSAKDPTVFDLSDGFLQIQEGFGLVTALTSDEVVITDLQFSNISYMNTPGTVRIQMTIKLVNLDNRQEYNFEKTFYTTASLRSQ